MVTRERKGERNWEIGIVIYTLLYMKQISNKNLGSTGNSIQHSVTAYIGKDS